MNCAARFVGLAIVACGLWTSAATADVLAEYTYENTDNFSPEIQGWTLGEGTEEDVNFFNQVGTSLLIIEDADTETNVHFTHTVPTNAFFDAWSFTGTNRFASNSHKEFGMVMFADDGTNLWHMSWINTANDDIDGIWMGGDPNDEVETATQMWVETVGPGPGGTLTNKPLDGFFDWALVDSDGAGGAPPKLQLEGEDLELLAPVLPAPSMFPAGTVGWGCLNSFETGFFQTQHMVFDGNPDAVPPEGVDGDFNDDDSVDAADYVTWRKNNGGSTALPNDNGLDTPIRPAHYDLWKANFGHMALGSGSGLEGGVVPEPSSLLLVLGGMLVAITKGTIQRRRQHESRRA